MKSDEGRSAEATQQRVAAILDGLGGRTAIAARRAPMRRDAEAEETARLRADEVFPAGRLASLPIAVEVLRRADLGQFSLGERVDHARSMPQSDEDGALDDSATDAEPTIGDLCARMIGVNDVTAANVLLEYVGMGEINETLSRLKLGRTKLARQLTDGVAHVARRENVTSADDMLTLLTLIHGRALPGSQRLLGMLSAQLAPEDLAEAWLPTEARLARCGAAQGDLVHDAGLLTGPGGACVYCILTAEQPDVAAAHAAIGQTLRLLWTDWRLG